MIDFDRIVFQYAISPISARITDWTSKKWHSVDTGDLYPLPFIIFCEIGTLILRGQTGTVVVVLAGGRCAGYQFMERCRNRMSIYLFNGWFFGTYRCQNRWANANVRDEFFDVCMALEIRPSWWGFIFREQVTEQLDISARSFI
ncbi:hypothetical protein PM082_020882 [Marasmius tenuissimus]|nr:hypothetical protein PM082_020882 [Marasmius tenuissimus]